MTSSHLTANAPAVGKYDDLRGKIAVVTGGFSGIGYAVAEHLVHQGTTVHAVGLPGNGMSVPDGVTAIEADITDPAHIQKLLELVPTVDLLVNAAGISRPEVLDSVKPDTWDATFEVNTKALFFLTQKYVSTMRPGSSVVNFASIAGKSAKSIDGIAYNSSKAAVIAMTKTFAHALATKGIRVNSVCPGVTDTPMLTGIFNTLSHEDEAEYERLLSLYLEQVPLGRLADPVEIAAAVIFLLSSASSYMTGQAINVSGGLVMW